MFNQIQFGKRIQQLRKDRGLTQKQAAEQLHISTNHVAKLEIGIGSPSLELCTEMARVYNTSLDYLIAGIVTPQDSYKLAIHKAIEILSAVESQMEESELD